MPYTPGVAIINGVKYQPYISGVKHTFPYYKEQDEHTLLLLHGDSLEDSSMYQVPITNNGVVVSTDQSKFGGNSLYFNGSSRLLIPNTTITFGSSDFTIDWWERCSQGNVGCRFSSAYSNAEWGGLLIGFGGSSLHASTKLKVSPNSWDIVSGLPFFSVTVNEWVHWALVRNGNIFSSYKNGNLFYSVEATGSIAPNTSFDMSIGDFRTGDHSYFTGYMNEFRISNIARWTSNFTPPTEPYEI